MTKKTRAKGKGKYEKKTKGNVQLGILCESQNGGYYIKLSDNVDITINGVNYEGEYINLQDPLDKFEYLLKEEYIEEDEYNEKVELYGEGGDYSYIRQFVSLKL
jgi:hypothetical protein